jgi:hypothetical protein
MVDRLFAFLKEPSIEGASSCSAGATKGGAKLQRKVAVEVHRPASSAY